jgi:hypothetical protein
MDYPVCMSPPIIIKDTKLADSQKLTDRENYETASRNMEQQVLTSVEPHIQATYVGKTNIPCGEHDYKKFPGLEAALRKYADKTFGGGWDDLKLNVDGYDAAIYVSTPIVKPYGTPSDTTVILASNRVHNDSSDPFETKVELTGTFEDSFATTVEKEMSTEVATEIGGNIEIFSAKLSTKLSTTSRKGVTSKKGKSVAFKRTVTLKVPPKRAFQVKMEAVVENRKITVTLPCHIEGWCRVQYPRPRNGHYYWYFHTSAAATNGHEKTDMVTIVENGTAIYSKTLVIDVVDDN